MNPRARSDVPRATAAERLIAELATLDAGFEKSGGNTETRAAYERERAELKTRIAHALAEERTSA